MSRLLLLQTLAFWTYVLHAIDATAYAQGEPMNKGSSMSQNRDPNCRDLGHFFDERMTSDCFDVMLEKLPVQDIVKLIRSDSQKFQSLLYTKVQGYWPQAVLERVKQEHKPSLSKLGVYYYLALGKLPSLAKKSPLMNPVFKDHIKSLEGLTVWNATLGPVGPSHIAVASFSRKDIQVLDTSTGVPVFQAEIPQITQRGHPDERAIAQIDDHHFIVVLRTTDGYHLAVYNWKNPNVNTPIFAHDLRVAFSQRSDHIRIFFAGPKKIVILVSDKRLEILDLNLRQPALTSISIANTPIFGNKYSLTEYAGLLNPQVSPFGLGPLTVPMDASFIGGQGLSMSSELKMRLLGDGLTFNSLTQTQTSLRLVGQSNMTFGLRFMTMGGDIVFQDPNDKLIKYFNLWTAVDAHAKELMGLEGTCK